MPKIAMLNQEGAKVGEIELSEGIFAAEVNESVLHLVVRSQLAAKRQGTQSAKTRGEVRGGGAKPFRQKGRGAARAGSSRNPVWTGGGVAFGPRPRSFAKKVNKKVITLALKPAISERIVEGSVIVLENFAIADHKTRSAVAVLKNLKVVDNTILLTVNEYDQATVCATGNIANLVLRKAGNVNVYELLRFEKLVFTKEALDSFIGRLA